MMLNRLKNNHPTIAVLTNMVATPFSEGIIFGAADYARQNEYNLLCFSGAEIAKPARIDMSRDKIFDLIDTELIDGVILPMGSLSRFISRDQQLEFVQRFKNVPVVTVNSDIPGYCNIGYSPEKGMSDLVDHLVEQHGVTRFAFAGATGVHRATKEKMGWFIKALETKGIKFDERMYVSSDLYLNAPIPGLKDLFQGERESWPQAIVAGTDKQARNLLSLLRDLNLDVPDDIIVTGSTGKLDSQFTDPPLTSVLEPTYELGWHAAKRLVSLIDGQTDTGDLILPTSLEVRRSCGCTGRKNRLVADSIPEQPVECSDQDISEQVHEELCDLFANAKAEYKENISPFITRELTVLFKEDMRTGSSNHLVTRLQRELEFTNKTEWFFLWGQFALCIHNILMKHVARSGDREVEIEMATELFAIVQECNELAGRYRSYEADRYVGILREIGIQLNSEFDRKYICQQLVHGLNISDCFISIFEQAERPSGVVSNVISMRDGKCLEAPAQPYHASDLVPPHVKSFDDVFSLIVMPLSFKDEFIGTAVLNIGERKGIVYEGLLTQFSSALKNQIHVRSLQDKEARIRTLAYRDSLTGLANRTLLNERLNILTKSGLKSGREFAVLFIDLDGFKWINDSMGHDAGDILLNEVAKQFSSCLYEEDTLARFGGDEFVVILPRLENSNDAERTARRLIRSLSASFKVRNQQVFISASIGIAVYPGDGKTPEALVKNADKAMYRSKHEGKNRFGFYMHDPKGATSRTVMLRNLLHTALRDDNFRLVFQPQVSINTSQVCGVEALIRLSGPKPQVVGPGEFISLAEEVGLIDQIGLWVFKKTCEQQKAWADAGYTIKCAINVSAKQFQNENLTYEFIKILKETGADPRMIRIEVTENAIIHNEEGARNTLFQLVKYGLGIAIDDFGTGYASLSCLQKIPVDTLKIDRSFVRDCTTNEENGSIIAAIVMMAKSLKLKVVAEGVEKAEHVDFLRSLGCDEMQGFLFAKPMHGDQIPSLLHKMVSHSVSEESLVYG